jgi:aromatic ring-cleaving dioxygenase
MNDIDDISSYHAHVYFDEATVDDARSLCEGAEERFEAEMGRMHERPVGPHPRWSCQLAFDPEVFAEIIPWLAINRDGLTVFVHPNTGDALADHAEHALWMGELLPLELDVLRNP